MRDRGGRPPQEKVGGLLAGVAKVKGLDHLGDLGRIEEAPISARLLREVGAPHAVAVEGEGRAPEELPVDGLVAHVPRRADGLVLARGVRHTAVVLARGDDVASQVALVVEAGHGARLALRRVDREDCAAASGDARSHRPAELAQYEVEGGRGAGKDGE